MKVINKFKKLINDPKIQKAVKEKVLPLVKKEMEKRKTIK
jgi:hypothetical protein